MNKTKPKFRSIALLTVLITLTVSCTVDSTSRKFSLGSSETEITDVNESLNTTIVSQDEALQFTIPQTWEDAWTVAEQERWTLLIQHSSGQAQIGARSWSKAENPEITIDLMTEIALQAGVAPFADAEIVKEAELISVNGYTAVQHQVRGTSLGYPLLATSTVVETPDYYHLVFTLAPEQDSEQQWNEAHQILQSLQEVQSTASVTQSNSSNSIQRNDVFNVVSPE